MYSIFCLLGEYAFFIYYLESYAVVLIIIEKGTALLMENKINENKIISKVSQINLWRNLSGKWEDTRTSEEIINDIYDSRTLGREFDL